jgi:hypothetical protein
VIGVCKHVDYSVSKVTIVESGLIKVRCRLQILRCRFFCKTSHVLQIFLQRICNNSATESAAKVRRTFQKTTFIELKCRLYFRHDFLRIFSFFDVFASYYIFIQTCDVSHFLPLLNRFFGWPDRTNDELRWLHPRFCLNSIVFFVDKTVPNCGQLLQRKNHDWIWQALTKKDCDLVGGSILVQSTIVCPPLRQDRFAWRFHASFCVDRVVVADLLWMKGEYWKDDVTGTG